jgi:uncharacterized protein (DUF1697 family)
MSQFVVFLRGINVGGRTVVKEKLREIFTSLGFQNVSTYKQSGNIIFDANSADHEAIKAKVEGKLRDVLGYDVAAFAYTITQLKQIIDLEPFKGQDKEGASFLITFLASTPDKFPLQLPLTIPKSTAQIISSKGTVVFSVTHGGGEGGLPNTFLESKFKVKATTRNLNIIREIVEKFSKNA